MKTNFLRIVSYLRVLACVCVTLFPTLLFAQIESGDIVSISVKEDNTYYYLAANDANNGVAVVSSNATEKCLWVITGKDGGYTFKNLSGEVYLRRTDDKDGNNVTVGAGNETVYSLDGGLEGVSNENKISFTNLKPEARYLRIDDTKKKWVSDKNENKASSFLIEKWSVQDVKGTLNGVFKYNGSEATNINEFGFASNADEAQANSVELTLTIERDKASVSYVCLADEDRVVTIEGAQDNSAINLKGISFTWNSKNQNSTATCEAYDDKNSRLRTLMHVEGELDGENSNNTKKVYSVTITPVGSSPMEMQKDGEWIDHVDMLTATFSEQGDAQEITYRSTVSVTRKSYHKEALPSFVVTANTGEHTFARTGGEKKIEFTCVHQHGEKIRHMYGDVDNNNSDGTDYIRYTKEPETLAIAQVANFSLKKMIDENAATWLQIVSEEGVPLISNTGELTIEAPQNETGNMREARLVGVFTYTNAGDPTDNHTETISIHLMQKGKDGGIQFIPNQGHSGEPFGKTPYGTDEQQVHTSSKTIYYLPNQKRIPLLLQEKNFRGYMRWYDYETGCNPVYNLNESDRTSWALHPKYNTNTNFSEINTENGDSHGLYTTANKGNITNLNTPEIKGWTNGAEHIIACDVSSHKDYDINVTGTTGTIKEPTLSYRQLFHLKPASEMAEKLDACKSTAEKQKYLETYNYMVPTGQSLLLSTEFRYQSVIPVTTTNPWGGGTTTRYETVNDTSICCYFYTKNEKLTRITKGCVWYKDDVAIMNVKYGTKDYLSVDAQNDVVGPVKYQLRLPKDSSGLSYDLLIAEFNVTYEAKDVCGPVASIITHDQIRAKYNVLEYIDFSFNNPAPGTGTSASIAYLDKHLPWDEVTYGYYCFDRTKYPNCDRQNTSIPYYGEYAILNHMRPNNTNYGSGWGGGEQHGGAANGYALYVDGTEEPGLVASISTDAIICSGQTLYCSMWFYNPRIQSGGSDPIFRCNIQGRNAGGEWQNVGIFYPGTITTRRQWQQVVFPINSSESYAETRVQIYNFGTGGTGNDFLLDDLCLYVSPLPLAAYQATMGCRSLIGTSEASTAVVVRLDYTELNADQAEKYIYYQIYNESDSKNVKLKVKDGENYVSAYYREDGNNISDEFGSVMLPEKSYVPAENLIQTSLTTYIDNLIKADARYGKCYVKSADNKYLLYVIHIIPNTQSISNTDDADLYLYKNKDYILRIASDYRELPLAKCAKTTPLHATQDTYLQLRNEKYDSIRVDCLEQLCANDQNFLDCKMQNTLAASSGGELKTIEARVYADWLVGFATDDEFCNHLSMTQDQKNAADAEFKKNYKCERSTLREAITYMRREPTDTDPNPNYDKSDPNELVAAGEFTEEHKKLIQRLCAEGLLQLRSTTVMFYLGSLDIARYWAYPISKTAKVMFEGEEYTLMDCDEPKWAKVQASYSEYSTDVSPEDTHHFDRLDFPTIRVLEGTEKVKIDITKLTTSTTLHSTIAPNEKQIVFTYNDVEKYGDALDYVDISNNKIEIVSAPAELEVGHTYTMRMAFYDEDGNTHIDGKINECRVGYIYFNILVVPKTLQWTGSKSPLWGDDDNWVGISDDGDILPGAAPLENSDVIIRKLEPGAYYPLVEENDLYVMDVNYRPNVCKRVYFEAGAMIRNQHLLDYNQAFVDMKIPAGTWNAMSAPLEGMYTGDMYIPHEGTYKDSEAKSLESDKPFVVNQFAGTRTNSALYAFWQGMYNQAVKTYHYNGNYSTPKVTDDAIFIQTNLLEYELKPGHGYQLKGYGRDGESELTIRLPKPDTYYSYYDKDGNKLSGVSVNHSSKLAFKLDGNDEMKITLNNQIEDNMFMFGNPTMANINMEKFLATNTNIVAYYSMKDNEWSGEAPLTAGTLAPMRSVLLSLGNTDATKAKQITITLKPEHLEVPSEYDVAAIPAAAPRKISSVENDEAMFMTIYSISDAGKARCILAAKDDANNIYKSDEDALFISSGVENESYIISPVNMYTVSEQVPMMVDVREKIDTVPLSMLVHDSYRTEKVKFAFYLSLNWDKECYFCDAVTGERYRIMDGLWLELDMPQNHEVRYFIDGPDVIDPDNGGDIWSSTEDVKTSNNQVWAYSPSQGQLVVASNDIIKAVTVYDIAGRLIGYRELEMQYNSTTFNTPTGACIVKAVLRDNTEHYISALVK